MQSTQTINVPASLGIPGLRKVLRRWRQLVLPRSMPPNAP